MSKRELETIILKNFWGIQLADSQYKYWEKRENYSKLRFNWQEFDVSRDNTLTDINISVAQTYPNYNTEKVKEIANGIYSFFKITKGDGILGFDGTHIIDKLGIITDEKTYGTKNEIELNVNWVKDFQRTAIADSFFEKKGDILKLTADHVETLKSLSIPIQLGMDKYLSSVSTLDNIYLKQTEPQKETTHGHSVKLFYGTNRNPTGNSHLENYYGNVLSTLQLGFCIVSIPSKHVPGEVERPLKIFHWNFKQKLDKHIMIEEIVPLVQLDFVTHFREFVLAAPKRSAFIFIHGFNVTYAEAARRTAQLFFDLKYKGVAGFFSWPASGKVTTYGGDVEVADSSSGAFMKFLATLIENTQIEELNIIAHSMGNRILTTTLKDISNLKEWSPNLKFFNNIVLGAPDIDQDVFHNSILPYFRTIGKRRTLYVNREDSALGLSQGLRNGRPKLGQGGELVYVSEHVDTVDASDIPSRDDSHSYLFEAESLINDLFYLINQNLEPINRRLSGVVKNGVQYWIIPHRIY